MITGTTHGIGQVTALELARAGHHVLMLCRDVIAATRVAATIRDRVPGAEVAVVHCDLSRLETVRNAASLVIDRYAPPALLINNAGVAAMRRRRTAAGMDYDFAVNHLGHFLLTELLRPHLQPDARIVIVASRIHHRGELDLAAVSDPDERIGPQRSYARSKLANVMHCLALHRRLAGSGKTVNCLHPGVVATHLLPSWLRAIKPLLGDTVLGVERGAATTLHLALSAELIGVSGRYFDEFQHPQEPAAAARDVARQEALWARSLEWTGLAADGTRGP